MARAARAKGRGDALRLVREADRHVGARIRARRLMLGLSQQQLAELIGVTYQQAHKYETGADRVAVGRLYRIARALAVEVGSFYEGLAAGQAAGPPPAARPAPARSFLALARSFQEIADERHRAALCEVARVLAGLGPEDGAAGKPEGRRGEAA